MPLDTPVRDIGRTMRVALGATEASQKAMNTLMMMFVSYWRQCPVCRRHNRGPWQARKHLRTAHGWIRG